MTGGSGGGNGYYSNLDQLYAIQAQQAQQLMGLAQTSVYPQYQTFVNQAMNYGSQANQERQAATAGADAMAAGQAAQQANANQMMSMGINPTDSRYSNNARVAGIQNAGQIAANMTGARDNVRNVGFARQQDAIGLGMGVPSNATAAAQGAAGTASTAANLRNQSDQIASANTANTVRGAMNLYTMAGYKDGGFVARKYASGGIIGAMPRVAPPPSGAGTQAPGAAAQAIGGAAAGLQGYKMGQGIVNTTAKLANGIGNATGSETAGAIGKGLNVSQSSAAGLNAGPPTSAMTNAAAQVDNALPAITGSAAEGAGATGAGTGAAAAGTAGAADAAGTAGAALADSAATAAAADAAAAGTTAAAGTAAGAGAAGAAATIGAAMPWVGAALALGSALNLFADGGMVYAKGGVVEGEPEDRVDGEHGGPVDGPGGPKDDKIPAWLSDGEFVMPVGAVQLFGVHRLEKMRQQGLEHERSSGLRG